MPANDHGRPPRLAPVSRAAAARPGRHQPPRPRAGRDRGCYRLAAGPRRRLPAIHARFIEARPLAERALAMAEAAYGLGYPTVATLRANLAAIVKGSRRPARDSPAV